MVNRIPILAALLMALASLVGFSPTAHASEPPQAGLIRSSVAAPNAWRRMNVDTFPRTITAAVAQCERDARFNASDRLTLDHCATFQQKLEAGQCTLVSVPDGQAYAFQNGRAGVLAGYTKRTGRNDVASRCNLGDNIYADWFNGQPGVSCFNLGIIIGELPVVVASDPEPKVKPRCRFVTRTRESQQSFGLFLPGFLAHCDCCGNGYVSSLWIPPSGIDNTSETVMVCD